VEVGRERQQQVGQRKDGARDHQQSARTKYHPEPGRYRPDQHLADGEGRGDPGTLIEAGVNGAPHIGEAEGRDAAIERRYE
jgi:hypothetical protein